VNAPFRVLVVEDLDFWQDTLHEVLADAGYQVGVASSYVEALDALAQQKFHLATIDLILDDANRHNRDGLRVLQYILDELPDMCAIVVTSSDPNHIRHEVDEISPNVPILWKDEWDDERFLAIARDLFARRLK
jgi:CheY-like chemotaxis protein